jgi:hypothetical protein
LFKKRERLAKVRDYFFADATEKDLPCREAHVEPIKCYSTIKWLKSYWAVRRGTNWQCTKDKVRGPVEALQAVMGEEMAADPVLAIGLDPKPMERDDDRFIERYEVVEISANRDDAQKVTDHLREQAGKERKRRKLAKRDIVDEIKDLVSTAKQHAKTSREKAAHAIAHSPMAEFYAQHVVPLAVAEGRIKAAEMVQYSDDDEVIKAAKAAVKTITDKLTETHQVETDGYYARTRYSEHAAHMLYFHRTAGYAAFLDDLKDLLDDYKNQRTVLAIFAKRKEKASQSPEAKAEDHE